MLFVGVDIGSTTTKCVVIDEEKKHLTFQLIFTGFDRNASGEEVLEKALAALGKTHDDVSWLVSTGYGRKAFLRANKDIPEIIAHGVGTAALYPDVATIIDIGGQDSKVIAMDHGAVTRFEMNDKCAAGTGRFFEVLTNRLLGIEMSELSDLIVHADNPCAISSMCTIFAESEIISYLSQGESKENIAAGVSLSIVRRVISMGKAGQITFQEPIVFSGGAANNESITATFAQHLGKPVTAVTTPQSTAALGAALTALKEYRKAHG